MAKNTSKVVNEMAYAADMTATDFQSLGKGMEYVGNTAHQAGFSISETASAMGILSNNGLESDKAGTGLRKTINSLVSPTDNATGALKKLGLSTSSLQIRTVKMKSMSDIFGILNSHMKGLIWS
jgi:phage tail tape measure protein, TP901 family, core region